LRNCKFRILANIRIYNQYTINYADVRFFNPCSSYNLSFIVKNKAQLSDYLLKNPFFSRKVSLLLTKLQGNVG